MRRIAKSRWRAINPAHSLWSVVMDEEMFKQRTKQLGLRVIRLAGALPRTRIADIIGGQLVRCATSVGANYRAACRGKSVADAANKLSIVEEEVDETVYWLEVLSESGIMPAARLKDLITEANEIVAMTVASIKTLRGKQKSQLESETPGSRNPKSKI